jgi:hypothetical protein
LGLAADQLVTQHCAVTSERFPTPKKARSPRQAPALTKVPLWLRLSAIGVIGFAAIAITLAYRDSLRSPDDDAPRVEFTVDGLDCPVWCAVRLTESIDHLDGARVESLDQKNGKVIVRHDPTRQNVAALQKLFAARGFAVQASQSVAPEPALAR